MDAAFFAGLLTTCGAREVTVTKVWDGDDYVIRIEGINQWIRFVEGEYILGLEPGNCTVQGREVNRNADTLQHIAPGQRREFQIEVGVLVGHQEVQRLEGIIRESRTMGA